MGLQESHTAVEALAKRAAEAQAAKNRAQQSAWKLRQQLQEEEAIRSSPPAMRPPRAQPSRPGGSQRQIEHPGLEHPEHSQKPPRGHEASSETLSVADEST